MAEAATKSPPMIEVKDLVKRYAGNQVVSGISFTVYKGEIVGFLGPNGAGKSTTMRILTGYLPATSGHVEIAGFEILRHSLEVRKRIGYMPENAPLYTDMTVRDFLSYRGALKHIPRRQIRKRIQDVMEKTSIQDISKKRIATLSRGYRQRVSLADALIHDPGLLILDEPTAGLDPNQIRSFRELVKDLGREHTILLSTHILPEVEMTCDRALIINHGKIEASDSLENLGKRVHSSSLFLEIKASLQEAVPRLEKMECVSKIENLEENPPWLSLECVAKPGIDPRDEVYQLIKEQNWPLREFRKEKTTLEDVFIELTRE